MVGGVQMGWCFYFACEVYGKEKTGAKAGFIASVRSEDRNNQ